MKKPVAFRPPHPSAGPHPCKKRGRVPVSLLPVFIVIAATLAFTACVHKVATPAPTVVNESGMYVYDNSHTVLSWTAYKFTARTAVSGSISDVRVVNTSPNANAAATLQNARFTLFEESMLFNHSLRDSNIFYRFLRKLMMPVDISGEVVSVTGTNDTGSMKVLLTINDVTDSVSMAYALKGMTLTARGSVDLARYNTTSAYDSMAVTCGKLHTGADGVSKVWTTVDISVETVFNVGH